jgi:outer membrane murein-binding lipoprotein Lpp
MQKTLLALAAAGALSGCVSKQKYDDLIAEQAQINEQKDSLVADVLAATQMVTEINADLARVKALGVSPTTSGEQAAAGKTEERQILLGKIREVIARLEAAEKEVEAQKRRVGSLQGERRRLLAQLETFEKTISDLKAAAMTQEALITEQRAQIVTLTSRVDTLVATTEQLSTERAAIADTLTRVTDEAATVYYAVGTEDELVKRGILVKEGSKFLVFGSKTLATARDLKPELFQKLDRRVDTVLTVPEPTKEYKIVTRQDPKYLSTTIVKNGRTKGDLHIANPAFWDAGKFLVLVRD